MTTTVKLQRITDLDLSTAVLVDGQTVLSTPPEYFQCSSTSERQAIRGDATTLHNLIQNLVLYDRVVVDSQLLALEENCKIVCEFFGDAVSGLLIDGPLRAQLAAEVVKFVTFERDAHDASVKMDHQHQVLLDEIRKGDLELRQYHYSVINGSFRDDVAEDLRTQAELLSQTLEEFAPPMRMFTGTNRSIERAHFYLELARSLGLYLSPHPTRAEYFRRTISDALALPKGFADKVVGFVDEKLKSSDATYFLNACWDIPPVAEYVIKFADDKHIDLISAILEVRNSKHARSFRKFCAEMGRNIRVGRCGMPAAQGVYEELRRTCLAWQRDVNEHVKYERRTLDLGEVWLIGGILKAFGMNKIRLKDPVIAVDKPYLLFLNDLYVPKY
jgi:hypothetical protein